MRPTLRALETLIEGMHIEVQIRFLQKEAIGPRGSFSDQFPKQSEWQREVEVLTKILFMLLLLALKDLVWSHFREQKNALFARIFSVPQLWLQDDALENAFHVHF
jgi:hypothetical protein